jgi:hypothetical protein
MSFARYFIPSAVKTAIAQQMASQLLSPLVPDDEELYSTILAFVGESYFVGLNQNGITSAFKGIVIIYFARILKKYAEFRNGEELPHIFTPVSVAAMTAITTKKDRIKTVIKYTSYDILSTFIKMIADDYKERQSEKYYLGSLEIRFIG